MMAWIKLAWLFPSNAFRPGHHFVDHGAKGEDVRPLISFLAFQLLLGHILERPEDRSLLGERCALRRQRRQSTGLFSGLQLRQPKVQELRPRLGQHDVAGLQIPMHDPLPVRLVQRIRNVDGDSQRLIQRQRALLQPLGQRLPVEILHDQEVDPVLVADVMEGADVRVVQRRDGFGFSLESLLEIRISRNVLGQHLDGDGAVQAGVAGLVDLTHPARADLGGDAVGTERGAGLEGHRLVDGHEAREFLEPALDDNDLVWN